jgi:hypothetical protein
VHAVHGVRHELRLKLFAYDNIALGECTLDPIVYTPKRAIPLFRLDRFLDDISQAE